MYPVGLANTRISTDYDAQKSPRSLIKTMEDGFFSWFDLMVQLPWFVFLRKPIYKVFGVPHHV